MNMLARREQSFFELTQKLTQRYPDFDVSDVILPALEKLREENLQSDERFVAAYIRYRSSRGHGPLKISMELQQKGIKSAHLQSELYSAEYDWEALCQDALARKLGPDPDTSLAMKDKMYRFLAQRGFENEQIRPVLKRVFN
jgi:regulatory protein